eukprot:CAMPEP_0174368018 /NCGR_PEP_ID=MMETSP0811_2-20130205/87502_1 /TAXON_ID=73025 ORGANISM="Eutreptiella gymnastica-like, Strain CCMP1594" /NCGR_SAMPLE_ID=MMETSP0811_2 /ASSEMBLY_ACC=CAM_ASM_000667 /LENGTH=177 /DNA_ID=CAMNT_0015511143 /DNA_START=18 /DNA_END=551 /DNA_ORIENTATION=+
MQPKSQGPKSSDDDKDVGPAQVSDDTTEVEVRTRDGHLVESYRLTKQEQEALPSLQAAREKIASGNCMEALNHLIEAIRKTEGEEGIIPALDRAKAHAKEAREQDASASKPISSADFQTLMDGDGTLLEETGQEELIKRSMQEGSSVVCRRCHAVVASHRKEAHSTMWCPALDDGEG